MGLDLWHPKGKIDKKNFIFKISFLFLSKFVDLKFNSALLYNKGHNFWKSVSIQKISQNWIFPY